MANSESQVNGDSDIAPACQLWWGEGSSEKEQQPLPALLSGASCLPALDLMPDDSVLLHTSLVPFELLHQS